MGEPIRVLVIEDSQDDTLLLLHELRRGGFAPVFERVETPQTMRAALEKDVWDLVISDYSMPGFDAPSALEILQKKGLDLPFIIVSGTIGEETAVAAMRAGAHDYIMKRNLVRLAPAIEREMREVEVRREQKRAQEALGLAHENLKRMLEATVRALASTAEKRDPYIAGHQCRVAQLSRAIAQEMGLTQSEIEGVRIAALLHDIGKITVPAEILSKPGKLNEAEFWIIKMHPQIGFDISREIDFPRPVARAILQHHETLDGSGYPYGVRGEEILTEARIITVADILEAMSSHRPYRAARGVSEALEELSRFRGIRYDPQAVDACWKLFYEKAFAFEPLEVKADGHGDMEE